MRKKNFDKFYYKILRKIIENIVSLWYTIAGYEKDKYNVRITKLFPFERRNAYYGRLLQELRQRYRF